ncbi:hypothetical protein F5Y08DRAFT_320943 [Xylaria arbuscula]|nr:hypothetical protein F5Y08DRAFT_320943 [Xylaria arbuscula]
MKALDMGTPFITFLEPSRLDGYKRNLPHDQQPAHIPRTFKDAMSVREAVFVRELKLPLEHQHELVPWSLLLITSFGKFRASLLLQCPRE